MLSLGAQTGQDDARVLTNFFLQSRFHIDRFLASEEESSEVFGFVVFVRKV